MNKKINLGSHRWDPLSNRELEYIKWDHVPEDIEYQRKELRRSFYDRDYEKVIILFFQSGAGGLFLANCLSLSNSVCSSFIDINEKVELLDKYLDSQGTFWNDLYINNYYPEAFNSDLENRKERIWHTVDGYFFVHEHEAKNIPVHFDFWSNCNMIYFKNPDLFCKIRKLLKNFDGRVGYMSYEPLQPNKKEYPIPSSFSEFFKLSVKEQNELKKAYKSADLYSGSFLKNKKLFCVWDTNWYFSEEDTVTHIKELYDLFGFSDFNKDAISNYYLKWISKLDELSQKGIPKDIDKLLNDEKNYDIPISNFKDLT